jgi:hypothetical protein
MRMREKTALRVTRLIALVCAVGYAVTGAAAASSAQSISHERSGPNFGANVIVFNPAMPQATIQSTLDSIATQQVPNSTTSGARSRT